MISYKTTGLTGTEFYNFRIKHHIFVRKKFLKTNSILFESLLLRQQKVLIRMDEDFFIYEEIRNIKNRVFFSAIK